MSLNATFDRASAVYAPGDTITLTVTNGPLERNNDQPISVTVSVPGLGETVLTGKIDRPDTPVQVTDADRVWTLVSDNGATAVFTATA